LSTIGCEQTDASVFSLLVTTARVRTLRSRPTSPSPVSEWVLDTIAALRGYPQTIVMDNGLEMVSLAMLRWAVDRGVRLHHIAPGKPIPERLHRELQRPATR
jgi:transposase InsO family protein